MIDTWFLNMSEKPQLDLPKGQKALLSYFSKEIEAAANARQMPWWQCWLSNVMMDGKFVSVEERQIFRVINIYA